MNLIDKARSNLRSDSGRAAASVTGGALVAQIITVLAMPVITRLFNPEAIGLQSIFVAFGTILSSVAAMSYPLAIALPDEDSDSNGLIIISLIIGVTTSIACLFAVIIFHDQIASILKIKNYHDVVYLLPLYMIFSVLAVVITQYFVRKKRFNAIAKVSWQFSAIVNTLKILTGYFYASAIFLIIINVAGGLIKFIISIRFLTKRSFFYIKNFSSKNLFLIALKYRDYPQFRTPQALVFAASQSVPIIVVAAYCDINSSGQFVLAMTLLSLPANILGSAISQVIYSVFLDAVRADKNVSGNVCYVTILLLVMGAPLFLLIACFGSDIFIFAFGPEWAVAGKLSQFLSLMMLLDFLSRPAAVFIPIIGLQQALLFFELILIAVKLSSLLIAFELNFHLNNAVFFFSAACAIFSAIFILWTIRKSKTHLVRRS